METVHRGQKEAAACLSFSKAQVLGYIVLPQAIEKMYPALVSQFVLMMLATSIMSEISAEELTAIGYQIQSQTFRGFEVYLVIAVIRSEEHTSELQSLMRISYAVFCLKKKINQ